MTKQARSDASPILYFLVPRIRFLRTKSSWERELAEITQFDVWVDSTFGYGWHFDKSPGENLGVFREFADQSLTNLGTALQRLGRMQGRRKSKDLHWSTPQIERYCISMQSKLLGISKQIQFMADEKHRTERLTSENVSNLLTSAHNTSRVVSEHLASTEPGRAGTSTALQAATSLSDVLPLPVRSDLTLRTHERLLCQVAGILLERLNEHLAELRVPSSHKIVRSNGQEMLHQVSQFLRWIDSVGLIKTPPRFSSMRHFASVADAVENTVGKAEVTSRTHPGTVEFLLTGMSHVNTVLRELTDRSHDSDFRDFRRTIKQAVSKHQRWDPPKGRADPYRHPPRFPGELGPGWPKSGRGLDGGSFPAV